MWATASMEFPKVIQTEFGKMSTVICRDLIDKVPASVGKQYGLFSDTQVDLVAAPVNWSSGGFPAVDWMQFAQNNTCVLAVANRWGVEENRSFKYDFGQGGSVIIDRDLKPHIGGLLFGSDSVVAAMVHL